MDPKLSNDTRFVKIRHSYDPVEPFEVDPVPFFFVNFSRFFEHFSINFSDFRQKTLRLFRRFTKNHWLKIILSTTLERPNPEFLSNTRFFKFRLFYDFVEPFKVDPYPGFSAFSEITVQIQAFSDLH